MNERELADNVEPDNGPAFPFETETHIYPGASLRDYFAARAPEPPSSWWGGGNRTCGAYAMWNYQYADAMLRARKENGQ